MWDGESAARKDHFLPATRSLQAWWARQLHDANSRVLCHSLLKQDPRQNSPIAQIEYLQPVLEVLEGSHVRLSV